MSTTTQPSAYLVRWKEANALAFTASRTVAVTDTALHRLPDDELAAIVAHEIAHLDEPPRIRVAHLAGQFTWLPFFLMAPWSATWAARDTLWRSG